MSITEKSLHMCKRIDVKTFRDHKEIQPGLDAGSEAMRFCYTTVFLNTNFLSKRRLRLCTYGFEELRGEQMTGQGRRPHGGAQRIRSRSESELINIRRLRCHGACCRLRVTVLLRSSVRVVSNSSSLLYHLRCHFKDKLCKRRFTI